MSKSVVLHDVITLGGHDISDWVSRWALFGEVGELHVAEVDIIVDSVNTPLTISGETLVNGVGPRGMTGCTEISHEVTGAQVSIRGTDISSHISGWREIVDLHKPRRVRLMLQADPDILTIEPK